MKIEKLETGYYQFGNKGAVWSDQTHIAKNSDATTLCGTPMLSSNWARIENHKTIGCKKCLEIYQKPTSEEWQSIMDSIKAEIGVAIEIPEKFGEYMIDHFTNCLPPIYWDSRSVLCSEPYDHNSNGEATYIGFYKKFDIYYGVICTVEQFKRR